MELIDGIIFFIAEISIASMICIVLWGEFFER